MNPRKVEILKYDKYPNKVRETEGMFMQYGYDVIEDHDGNIMFSTGIVELPDGTVRNVPVELLRFLDVAANPAE